MIALLMAASAAVSYILLTSLNTGSNSPSSYEKSILRNTDDEEERKALSAAENINYTDIFKVERFQSSNFSDYSHYTWANFIDAEVIKYYDDRYENLKGKPEDIDFRYEANVYAWDQFRIHTPPRENEDYYNDTIRVLSPNGTILFQNANFTGPNWGMKFTYRNGSSYQEIPAYEINLSFSNSYVVEMKMQYSEIYAPLAAFFSDNYQIIVLDQNFVPLLLCVQSKKIIS